jgi:hypothetical protein
MNENELYNRINLLSDEALSLKKENDTLNDNIVRKDNIIAGLYAIILNTKDIALIKQVEEVMINTNFDNKIVGA